MKLSKQEVLDHISIEHSFKNWGQVVYLLGVLQDMETMGWKKFEIET